MKVALKPGVAVISSKTSRSNLKAKIVRIVRYDGEGFYVARVPESGEIIVHEDDIQTLEEL